MRVAIGLAAFLASATVISAKPIACDDYAGRLADLAEKDGGKVYLPAVIKDTKLPAQSWDAWSFTGPFGAAGRLTCEHDGRFVSVTLSMAMSAGDAPPAQIRSERMLDFATIALCAAEPAPLDKCRAIARASARQSKNSFSRAAKSGDPNPIGRVENAVVAGRIAEDAPSATAIDYEVARDQISVTVHGNATP